MKNQTGSEGSEDSEHVEGSHRKVVIRTIPTGVEGLDEILGGGVPEFSLNLIAGLPGSGKTTLAHQIVFANATEERPVIYFTVLGEPPLKMLRYQQQYTFFDPLKVGTAVKFVNLSDLLLEGDLEALYGEITKQVEAIQPRVIVVDSFRTLVGGEFGDEPASSMQLFIHRLCHFLTSWEATTFMVGEYGMEDIHGSAVFTIADGLIWLWQVAERNSVVRKLQVLKLRGHSSVPGLHTIRISNDGIQAFSRTLGLVGKKVPMGMGRRLSMGIPELDKMLGGGIREGDSVLIAGPSGTGKSALATQFIAEGVRVGEPGIMAIFEERPEGYLQRAGTFGLDLKDAAHSGMVETLYLRPLDLSVDETMREMMDAIERVGAKRLVIDSLVGFEMALAPGFRADFRESLYRMIGALTGAGITIVSTVEVEDTFEGFPFSHYAISFLTDDIIRMRYVEIGGQLRKVMVVIKMRGGNHSKDIREYVVTDKGVVIIGPRRTDFTGLTSGLPRAVSGVVEVSPEPKEPSE